MQAFLQGEIETVFVLPVDYLEPGVVDHYRTSSGEGIGQFWGTLAEWQFEGFLRAGLIAGHLEPDVMARALYPANYRSFDVADDGAVTEAAPVAQATGELTISTGLLATVSVSFVLGYFLFSVLVMFIGSVVSSAAEGQRQTGLLSLLVGLPSG